MVKFGGQAMWWDFSNFINAAGSTSKILRHGSGDRSNWSSTSQDGEALGDTVRELSKEDDEAVGWKCLNF
jgi:hypothetical protein